MILSQIVIHQGYKWALCHYTCISGNYVRYMSHIDNRILSSECDKVHFTRFEQYSRPFKKVLSLLLFPCPACFPTHALPRASLLITYGLLIWLFLPTERSLQLFSSYLSFSHTHRRPLFDSSTLSVILSHPRPPSDPRLSIPSAFALLGKSSYPSHVTKPKEAYSQN